MVDLNKTLRSAYYSLLNGNPVAFYDQVPSGATFPYIYCSGFTDVENSTKDQFGHDVTFTITLVNRFQANYGGQGGIDDIASQVENTIKGAHTRVYPLAPLILPNFNLVSTKIDNSDFQRVVGDDGVYFYRTIRFRHFITQFNQ